MKRNIIILILLILFLAPIFVIVPEIFSDKKKYIRNGEEYGVTRGLFRGRWWNYFERGQSFAEGEFWEEAESDLKKAIEKRFEDNRRARSYGLHFVEYFPHRELGVVYFRQDKYEDAEPELILSLSHEESAKAKFYLNKARKSTLKRDKSDKSAPVISITTPYEGTIISNLNIRVTGASTDDKYVSEMEVNGKPVFIETADKKINFSQKVRLKPGNNTIIVTATDLTGKVTYKKVHITVDRQAPLLSIESIERFTKNSYTINGVITDEAGVAELNIGGESIPISNINETLFSHTVSGPEGSGVAFKAVDSAGNTTDGTIVLETLSFAQTKNIRTVSSWQAIPVRYASLMSDLATDAGIHAGDKKPTIKPVTADDTIPPFITLKERIKEKQTVYTDSFFIEGKVKDAGGIVSLTINDKPILIRPGIKLFFNYLPELEEGPNELVIIATDSAGNSSKETIVVKRKIPVSHQITSRLATAILPFQNLSKENTFSTIFSDSFLDTLFNLNRFNFLARADDLEAILAEQKLSTSDLADKSAALRLGKIVSAEIVIGGTVMETSKFMQIYARVIDTETTEIMVSTDVYGEEVDMETFKYLIDGLAWKIVKSFPMIEGMVVKFDKNNVYLDSGAEESVRKNMRFIIYRPVKVDTNTSESGDIAEMLCEAKVSNVGSNISKLEIVRQSEGKLIQLSDLAITK